MARVHPWRKRLPCLHLSPPRCFTPVLLSLFNLHRFSLSTISGLPPIELILSIIGQAIPRNGRQEASCHHSHTLEGLDLPQHLSPPAPKPSLQSLHAHPVIPNLSSTVEADIMANRSMDRRQCQDTCPTIPRPRTLDSNNSSTTALPQPPHSRSRFPGSRRSRSHRLQPKIRPAIPSPPPILSPPTRPGPDLRPPALHPRRRVSPPRPPTIILHLRFGKNKSRLRATSMSDAPLLHITAYQP